MLFYLLNPLSKWIPTNRSKRSLRLPVSVKKVVVMKNDSDNDN